MTRYIQEQKYRPQNFPPFTFFQQEGFELKARAATGVGGGGHRGQIPRAVTPLEGEQKTQHSVAAVAAQGGRESVR